MKWKYPTEYGHKKGGKMCGDGWRTVTLRALGGRKYRILSKCWRNCSELLSRFYIQKVYWLRLCPSPDRQKFNRLLSPQFSSWNLSSQYCTYELNDKFKEVTPGRGDADIQRYDLSGKALALAGAKGSERSFSYGTGRWSKR